MTSGRDFQSGLSVVSNAEWVSIQRNTFKNWVNEQLTTKGLAVQDLRVDLADGVCLVELVESLQRKKLQGTVTKPSNEYERLQNLSVALDSIAEDNVRIVNIGTTDLTEGNVKLILALVWQLILRYQIGLTNIQHKSWLLAWLQAVIPECNITNFTTDWNDGVALHALLEFCSPGLCSNWKRIERAEGEDNCRKGMKIARQQFGIPLILRPEHFASCDLDELSTITYLSYFVKVGAPGYNATLQRLQPLVRNVPVFNFTTDWNDGRALCELVKNLGGNIGSWSEKKGSDIERLQDGLDGAVSLGVQPLLTAADIAEEDSEHLGVMAYTARFLNQRPTAMSGFTSYEQNKVIMFEEKHKQKTVVNPAPMIPKAISDFNVSTNMNNEHSHLNPYNLYTSVQRTTSEHSIPTIVRSSQQRTEENVKYNLVRTPSLRRARKEVIDPNEGVKIDTYSVGVVISSMTDVYLQQDNMKLEVESPSGRVIKLTGDGRYNAQFSPDEIGAWRAVLYCDGKLIDTCTIEVCDPSQVKVIDMKGGIVGRPNKFQVDCTKAGNGELEVLVKHDTMRVPSFVRQTRPGFYDVHFTPYTKGTYKVSVTFSKAEIRDDDYLLTTDSDGMHRRVNFNISIEPDDSYNYKYKVQASCDWQIDYVTGGPFEVSITDFMDVKVYSMQDGSICDRPHLIADCTNAPGGMIEAEVTYNNFRFPAEVIETKPNVYRVSFRPRGRGVYKIWVVYGGTIVKGSPFIQEIDELVSPKATGNGLQRGLLGEAAQFNVDARGFPGDLEVDIQGPHHPVRCTVNPENDVTHTVTYIPQEIGQHKVQIKLAGRHIERSPFLSLISDPSKIRVYGEWRPQEDGNDCIPLVVNKEKQIPFDASDAGQGEITAEINGPSYKIPTTVDSRQGGKQILVFTPREEGKHYIEVYWNGFPLPRTPYIGNATRLPETSVSVPVFQPIIIKRGHSTGTLPRRDEIDAGWVRAVHKPEIVYVGQQNTVPIKLSRKNSGSSSSSDAVLNKRKVSIVKIDANLPDKRGSMYSSTTSEAKSTTRVSATYTTNSPTDSSPPSRSHSDRLLQRPPSTDPTKVILSGKGLKEAFVYKPATFKVDGKNAGPGEPEIKVTSVRHEIPVIVRPIGDRKFQCTYTPQHPGAYLLDITWNKRPLKCCPFKVNVHEPTLPHKVNISGDPLTSGIVGRDIQLNIDPRAAGKGELEVNCFGPNNQHVPVVLADNYDGTRTIKIKPVEPGRHILNIQYGGEHVLGSPYAIDIRIPTNHLNPVKVYGPGIENGILPQYESHFMVDARGAGAGDLHVSVMGPKGAFQVEMRRTSQKDKLFHCRYSPVEPGVYTVNVLWSGQHVGNSPFRINLAMSQAALDQMIMERRASLPPSQTSQTPVSVASDSLMY